MLQAQLTKPIKLLPNQVFVKDDTYGQVWIYDIENKEELAFLEKRGTRDDSGNLVLSMPLLASLKKWNTVVALGLVEAYMQEINVPEIRQLKRHELPQIENLANCTNSQLEEMLAVYGGYKAYLETQLAYVESKKGIYEATFEESLSKMLYILSSQNEKRVNQDILHGQAIANNPQLKKLRQELIEIEGIYVRVLGLRNGYKSLYDAISRVVALRTSSKEQV